MLYYRKLLEINELYVYSRFLYMELKYRGKIIKLIIESTYLELIRNQKIYILN